MAETHFLVNYGEEVAILLFGIGFANLLVQKNLIKKIIGLNIMDTAVYLFLAERGILPAGWRLSWQTAFRRWKLISIRSPADLYLPVLLYPSP